MTGAGVRILIIEDSMSCNLACIRYLQDESYGVAHVKNGKQALASLNNNIADVILLDMRLSDIDGTEILRRLAAHNAADRVIVMIAPGAMNLAHRAIAMGAYDFVTKPCSRERLVTTVNNLIRYQRQGAALKTLKGETGSFDAPSGFIGSSAAMQTLYRSLRNVSASDTAVMITGEPGTGKGLCAEALHKLSVRNGKNFVRLNCATIPQDLLEREIFGHAEGAFTGAIEARAGAVVRANGGVLFLNQICALDVRLQTRLLRVLQTLEVQPVGGVKTTRVDIRIIAATDRDMQAEVRAGRFCPELFYRLNVVPIHLPPLREREKDVIEIAENILKQYSKKEHKEFQGFSAQVENLLLRYSWPGNVRELIQCIHHTVAMNSATEISDVMLKRVLDDQTRGDLALNGARAGAHGAVLPLKPLREIEIDYLREALRVSNQSISRAAALLDISPSTIYRRLKDLSS